MGIQRPAAAGSTVNTSGSTGTFGSKTRVSKGGKEYKAADGFLNIKIKTKSGEYISVPCTIGLDADNPIHAGLLAKFAEDPNFVFEIQGQVHVASTIVPEF